MGWSGFARFSVNRSLGFSGEKIRGRGPAFGQICMENRYKIRGLNYIGMSINLIPDTQCFYVKCLTKLTVFFPERSLS